MAIADPDSRSTVALLSQRCTSEQVESGDCEFDAILTEFKRSPRVVAERLFIEGVETAFAGAGQRKLVQPPVGDEYHDFRITVSTR